MKKNIMFVIAILVIAGAANGVKAQEPKENIEQENSSNSSIKMLDLSLGYGTHYGGLGSRLMIGQVAFAGAGTFDGETMMSCGIQVPLRFSRGKDSINTPYMAFSYGGIGVMTKTYNYNFTTETDKEVVWGWSVIAGYSWRYESGLFLHVDGGFSRGKVTLFENTPREEEEDVSTIALNFGIGYNFF